MNLTNNQLYNMKNFAIVWLLSLSAIFGCETSLAPIIHSEYTRMFVGFFLATLSGLIIKWAEKKWFGKRRKNDN